MLIGYARVPKEAQSLALQLDALAQAGCPRVSTDKASGAKRNRPDLTEASVGACLKSLIKQELMTDRWIFRQL